MSSKLVEQNFLLSSLIIFTYWLSQYKGSSYNKHYIQIKY